MHAWTGFFLDAAGRASPLFSACALVTGIIILLLGWRLSLLVAVTDFSLFGVLVGAGLASGTDLAWLTGAIGAVAFGSLALWLRHYAEIVSCGLLAGLGAALLMGRLTPVLPAVMLVTVVAFGCAVALTYVAYRQTSVIMTALQGGVLTAFGLLACLSCSGTLWSDVLLILSGNPLAQLLLPAATTGIGVTFQLASVQHEEAWAS